MDASEFIVPEDQPWEQVNQHFEKQGWTDGLPIVPPTARRVAAMLGSFPAHASLGKMPPALREVTAGAVAVQAVMAGCEPSHFPVLWAALGALLEAPFNLMGIQTTTGNATPAVFVNGPARKTAGIHAGANCLGPHSKSNATIGRAVRLCLANIGGATPGVMDMATLGQPAKFTFCFAENEEDSPWEPFHVTRGYAASDSTVTVFGAAGIYEIVDTHSRTAEESLQWIGTSLTPLGTLGVHSLIEGGSGLLLLAPETAQLLARDGLSKADVRQRLFALAEVPLDRVPATIRDYVVATRRERGDVDPEAPIRLFKDPDHLLVVVAGGVGIKSAFIPGWGGGSDAVTRRVEA